VILKDVSHPSQPIEVARQEPPYSFDVRSSKPRIKEPTSDQTQQANIDASSEIRRGTKYPDPAAAPSPPPEVQLEAGPHLEGIERPARREQMAGETSDRDHATNGHILSIGESEQQSPSDVQHLPSAIPVFHPSCAPKPPLAQDVQPRHGSCGGEDRDSLEGCQASVITMRSENTSLGINVPRTSSASNDGAQRISHGGIREGHSYDTLNILGQQKPPPFALAHRPSFQSLRTPTQTRAKVAERQAQINVFEIRDLRANFEAESQEKLAPLQSIMDHVNGRILAIQNEIVDHWNVFSAERQKAEAVVMAKVTDLEVQIHALKQGGSYAASVLALSEIGMERKL